VSTPPQDSLSPDAIAVLANAEFVEALYEQWKGDPSSLSREWQMFFQGFEMAMCPRNCVASDQAQAQSKVASLIYNYRALGHMIAQLDPLGNNLTSHPQLELEAFGFTEKDLDRVFDTGHLGGAQRASLREIIAILRDTYCRSIGVEYLHIQNVQVRRWLQAEMEPIRNRPRISRENKIAILRCLIDAELFENFTHGRYLGQKRFSIEGGESIIAALHGLVELAPEFGVEEIVMGMAHRGRLNVLANILDKSYSEIFSEFEGNFLPNTVGGDGDVKYHRGYTSDRVNAQGRKIHVTLTSNPSHLEAVDPVVEGRARAKQRQRKDLETRTKVLPLLIHGEAAFSGQGLVAETLNLSQLEGYTTGGTFHLIANNQIGFTTLPKEAHSTYYSTDVAKMVQAPIFHVNGDDPEAVVFATELALRFRQEFHRDVVVDMICYRRHGHNEADEPMYTQPVLYRKIKDRPSVRKLYTKQLIDSGDLTSEQADAFALEFKSRLERAYEYVKEKSPDLDVQAFEDRWRGLNNPYCYDCVDTGVKHGDLVRVAKALTTIPDGFTLNPKVARRLPQVFTSIKDHGEIDWATAELLAFGTLILEGTPVRLSGQDSARGTFSQRHAVWHDMESQEPYVPLNHLALDQPKFGAYNSMLSEAAVLGFEYGYSLSDPMKLVIWEAQFGDFANGAQVIIDQFIVSSESKWQRTSGLVMLLPHGYEGQGPEHSNAYLERYLVACAEDNIQVCNITTPAQYFHVLRRQMKRKFRRPLIILSPKSLLRHPLCVSPVDELITGRFQEILDDPRSPRKAQRLVLCSGKIYFDLLERREAENLESAALIRIEQFYPFHEETMDKIQEKYRDVTDVVWAQEEPQNRGGWAFMFPRLLDRFPNVQVRYVGREASASPATGSLRIHREEQEQIAHLALQQEEEGRIPVAKAEPIVSSGGPGTGCRTAEGERRKGKGQNRTEPPIGGGARSN
jgi:2-oxoglutarate dehydrogenase E1 component